MNYPYSTFIFEAQRAKQRLERLFQAPPDRRAATLPLANIEGFPANGEKENADDRRMVSTDALRRRDELCHYRKNKALPNESHWTREDMGTLSFSLTLLLLWTVAAMQTEHPVHWLLIGPVPLAVGLTVAALIRPRFSLRTYVRNLRYRPRQSRDRASRSCPCQCQ
jgi:hypothetical protein